MITETQLKALLSLPIKWPVRYYDPNYEIVDDAGDLVLDVYGVDEVLIAFLVEMLNALHKDPDRFNQLLNE